MHNDIQIGPITIHMYGVMIAIGLLMALLVTSKRAKKRDLSEDIVFDLFFSSIIGGAIGTRLLYYLVSIPEIIEDPSILWNFSNGYVVYGGIIGGIIAGMILCKKIRKVEFLPYFDLVMPAVAMAQGFGRIGCFFAGCCYGKETDSVFGITYWNSKLAPNGVKLIPTQLISSAGDFVIFAVLLFYARKERAKGRVAALYLILYSVGRFFVEFLRNDYRGSVGSLSTSQFISIGMLVVGLLVFFWKRKEEKEIASPEQFDEKAAD